MLPSDANSNNTSAVQLDVTERKVEPDSDHDDLMEDTLEAEISKLEITINDLELSNDLPDIDSSAYDLEEGEILDSMIHEGGELADSGIFKINEVIDNDGSNNGTFSKCDDNIDGGRMSQNIEYNKEDKHTVSSELNDSDGAPNTVRHEKKSIPDYSKPSKTLQANSLTYSPQPKTTSYQECSAQHQKNDERDTKGSTFQQELRIPNKNVFNPMKSVIISNNYEEVSLRSQDCELCTNDVEVHLNSINRSDTSSNTTQCGTNAERNKICPVETDKDSTIVIRSSLLVDVDAVIHESSQLDVSEVEEELLYPDGADDDDDDDSNDDVTCTFSENEDNEPLVSSTPFKIKAESLKRWKPTFLSVKESFLILDEFGESSDQEQSVCTYINSSVHNSSVPKVSATHSMHPTSFTHNSLFFKVNKDSTIADIREGDSNDTEQTRVASGEGRDLKVVVNLSSEANDDGSQSSSSSSSTHLLPVLTNATPVQGHHVEDNTDNVLEENTLVPNFPSESMDQNSLEQKPNIISKYDEDYVSNNPQENEDNNNPEWELLRKLETDEERYRAMRQRWRNLIIPDPNQDLTYRNWRIRQNANKSPASASSMNKDAVVEQTSAKGSDAPSNMQDQHKRAVSDEQASSQCQPRVKRPRTQSCTAVFDVKLEQLRRNIEREKQQIYDQEQVALLQLSMKQIEERNYLQNFCYTYGINEEMRQLYFRQLGVGNFWHIVEFSFQ